MKNQSNKLIGIVLIMALLATITDGLNRGTITFTQLGICILLGCALILVLLVLMFGAFFYHLFYRLWREIHGKGEVPTKWSLSGFILRLGLVLISLLPDRD